MDWLSTKFLTDDTGLEELGKHLLSVKYVVPALSEGSSCYDPSLVKDLGVFMMEDSRSERMFFGEERWMTFAVSHVSVSETTSYSDVLMFNILVGGQGG